MPAPSRPFQTILVLVLWNGRQICRLIAPDAIKCLPFNISFIFGKRNKSLGARSGEHGGCSSTIICLLAKNSLTDSAVRAGALSWWKFHELLAKVRVVSVFFTLPFQYFQIVNLVDCLSIQHWGFCPLLPRQAHGGEFLNFIVTCI
jgi:hypothetical protein